MASPLSQIARAARSPEKLTRKAIRDPDLVPDILEGLSAEEVRTKYGCAKVLRLLSEQQPNLLYPHFSFFSALLDHPNKIIQWEGALVLAQLTRVDRDHKFEPIFQKYFAPIKGPVMITAANVIRGATQIALAKPQLASRIAAEVLKVAKARYQTVECRNVAIGHAVLSLGEFVHLLDNRKQVLEFVKKQLKNSRPATRTKAEKFLKQHQEDYAPAASDV